MSNADSAATVQAVNVYVRRTIDAAEREAKQSFPGAEIRIDLPGDFPEGITQDILATKFKLVDMRQPSLFVVFDSLTLGTDVKAVFVVRSR